MDLKELYCQLSLYYFPDTILVSTAVHAGLCNYKSCNDKVCNNCSELNKRNTMIKSFPTEHMLIAKFILSVPQEVRELYVNHDGKINNYYKCLKDAETYLIKKGEL